MRAREIGSNDSDEDGDMGSELTRAAAQARLHRYFVQTLHALPPEAALAHAHPEIPHARFHRGVVLPAADADPDTGLEFFDIAYWVTGTTPDTVDRSFDHIVRLWRELGWPITTDRPTRPRAVYTHTPDHFGLTVRQSVDGSVSLAGSTPPFPIGSPEPKPLPQNIEHPSASAAAPGVTAPRPTPWQDSGSR